MHILQLDVLSVADGKAPGRLNAVGGWLGIAAVSFVATDGSLTVTTEKEGIAAALLLHVFQCQSATELDVEILDADIANGVILQSCNQTSIATVCIGDMNIADADVAYLRGRKSLRSTHTVPQTNINRRVADVGHREVVDADVFHLSAVNGFEGESTAMSEATPTDGDVTEATVRLST